MNEIMDKRVMLDRQEDEDRRVRQEVTNLDRIVQNDVGGECWSQERYLGDHTRDEEDFDITEGEVEDLYDKLMEMVV